MTSATSSPSPNTTTTLRRLIDETSDIIDSPAFTSVLTRLLDAAFSYLIDVKISQLSYKIPPISADSARVTEIVGDGVKAKVANSLAVFCRQAHSIGAGANNEYLEKIEGVGELEAFAAVVYSSNFEFESPVVAGDMAVGVKETQVDKGVEELRGLNEEIKKEIEVGFESAWDKAVAK
jgi:peroxin-3